MFVFDDVISPYASTNEVFKRLLTFSDYENKNTPWYEKMNLLDIMRQTGYKTLWLSNQDKESFYRNSQDLLMQRADKGIYERSGAFDGALLDTYNKNKSFLDNKNFVIFHLMGSHPNYQDRYPAKDKIFQTKDIDLKNFHFGFFGKEKDIQIIDDYINSIAYTDEVLKNIFELFDDRDAIIFYLSDHAQDIFQSRHSVGHACTKYGVEIPFLIYVTKTFIQKHPEKIKMIKNALHKPFMTDDFIESFLPLVGIETQDNVASKNIFSPDFDEKRKRIFCDNMNYDGKR
ncbi:hypothetical protein BJI48_01245 [Helicobacter sp. 11S02596-1]|nr:hypothetical protein BJI48_01245 [Helicobacter sp. 11S02596-1]